MHEHCGCELGQLHIQRLRYQDRGLLIRVSGQGDLVIREALLCCGSGCGMIVKAIKRQHE